MLKSIRNTMTERMQPMKKMAQIAMAAWLCMLLCGCVGFSRASKVDDGAVYELNREMYVAEKDGLFLLDKRTEHPEYYTIRGTLPARTKLQEATEISYRGFSFWWYFGPYSHVAVYGKVLEGDFKGSLVGFGNYRQCCPKHGYWYLCPLGCPDRDLKCLTPEKYDQKHIRSQAGIRYGTQE